jgi:molybdate-binding protein/DNA-binding transcriptional regulator YhcF (GntR family)
MPSRPNSSRVPSTFDFRPASGKGPLYARLAEVIRDRVASGVLGPGDRLPPIRQLAHVLRIHTNTVARSYAELEREGVLATRRGGGTFVASPSDDPVLAALREERLRAIVSKAALEALSLGYTSAQVQEAMRRQLSAHSQRHDALRVAGGKQAKEPTEALVIVGSDDLALGLLVNRLGRERSNHRPVLSVHAGSLGGLLALSRGEAHLAGVHLWDAVRGQYNVSFVARMFPTRRMVLVNLAHRQQGLMVHRRNPKRIGGLEDLARQGIVLVNRQQGSGTRLLLDYELKRRKIDPSRLAGYDHEVNDHVAVAECVANMSADVGMGTLPAARALGLEFIPVRSERYDLVMFDESYESEMLKPLLRVLRSDAFREAVDHLGGYDTSQTGDLVARLDPSPAARAAR